MSRFGDPTPMNPPIMRVAPSGIISTARLTLIALLFIRASCLSWIGEERLPCLAARQPRVITAKEVSQYCTSLLEIPGLQTVTPRHPSIAYLDLNIGGKKREEIKSVQDRNVTQ
jgi:hypothetical protein